MSPPETIPTMSIDEMLKTVPEQEKLAGPVRLDGQFLTVLTQCLLGEKGSDIWKGDKPVTIKIEIDEA